MVFKASRTSYAAGPGELFSPKNCEPDVFNAYKGILRKIRLSRRVYFAAEAEGDAFFSDRFEFILDEISVWGRVQSDTLGKIVFSTVAEASGAAHTDRGELVEGLLAAREVVR